MHSMYKALLILFFCFEKPLLASAFLDEEGHFAAFGLASAAFEAAPSQDTFEKAYVCARALVDTLTKQAQDTQRQILDEMWADRGDRENWETPDEDGVTWEQCEEKTLESYEDQARFLKALGRSQMTDLQMALTQRYGPFDQERTQEHWDRSKKQFACDTGGEEDLDHVGARRVDMLLGEAVCTFFKPRIAQIEARLPDLVPVWLWQQVSAFEEIPGVSQAFWMNMCRLPLGSRNFLWLLDRPELTEDFLSIQKTIMTKAGESYGMRWATPSFIALLEMPPEVYQQDMQALKAFVAGRNKEGMPLVDVAYLGQMCTQARFALSAFESVGAFVWCVDKALIKSQTTPPLLCLEHWSPGDAPVFTWLSYQLISSMTRMLDAYLNAFMGHLETAGHSKFDWVWVEPQSDEEQTASDTSDTSDSQSDGEEANEGAPGAA